MTTTNLFVIADVKQLRTGGSFRILLPFFQTSWGVGVLNSAIFKSFQNRVEFGTVFGGAYGISGGGVQQIQLRTEDRDLGAVALWSGVLEAAVISYKKFHFI
jgi:hypothetical protein